MLKPLLVAALLATSAVPTIAQADDSAYQRMCGNVLNTLPWIVSKAQVAAIPRDASVSVHPVCLGVALNDFGNAGGLVKPIAASPALARALAQWGYRADDVVGIVINGTSVQLYVHPAA